MNADEIKMGLVKLASALNNHPNIRGPVLDTELDCICHFLESQMTPEELDTYYYDFLHVKDEDHAYAAIANWEKRGPAILRFRGIVK